MATPPPPDINDQQLLLNLLKILSDGWVSPTHFERMVRELQIPDGAPTIFFLTGIQQILRELPFKVYPDDNARTAIIDAAQASIDAAIAREEALLEDVAVELSNAQGAIGGNA